MDSVFISYRRDDSAGHAGRLSEHLCGIFGPDHVFMDVQDIAPGQDFAEAIEKTITGCQAVVVVIGPRWAAELKTRGGQSDFVLHEVSVALRRSVTVIPVLVGGATMPSAAELPESIAALSRRQAVEIRDARFESDTTLLVDALRRLPGFTGVTAGSRRRMWLWLLAAAALVIVAAVAFLKTRPPSFNITGVWIAEMAKPKQPSYRVRLDLTGTSGTLNGTVAYPTGDGAVRDGTLANGRLTFFTTHVPQFASEPATIRWSGIVEGNAIQFTAADDSGVAKGTARRGP